MPDNGEHNILKINEAAKILNVAPQTLSKWRYQGRGPEYIKMGRNIRYSMESLSSFLTKSRVENRPRIDNPHEVQETNSTNGDLLASLLK